MILPQAARKGRAPSQISLTKSLAAPISGWNARDPLPNMDPKYAVILDNWFPLASQLMLRKGFINWATGITGEVESIMPYNSVNTRKLFCANSDSFFDVTNPGPVGAAVQTGLSNGKWQWVNFSTGSGTTYLYAVNGIDKPQLYDGTTWTEIDGVSVPPITGVTTTSLKNINVFKRRIWFVEVNTMKIWYLPTDSIGGVAQSIDFGAIFPKGGYLISMGTWTIDAGEGSDDHAAFITSEGEVAIYKGTDPSTADTWELVGVYVIGRPIGDRCFSKYGGDSIVICEDGLQPLSKVLISPNRRSQVALTDKIQNAMADSTSIYGLNFGWETTLYAAANMLIMNVPVSQGSQVQYVMNTITGAWCRFTGWAANTFTSFGDSLYFGSNGIVAKAWEGNSDNGISIDADALPAFNYFGGGNLKEWVMARPIFLSNINPSLLLGINVDFDTSAPIGTPSFTSSSSAIWDLSLWDVGVWGGGDEIKKDWQSVHGVGYCAALYLKISSNSASLFWTSIDYLYKRGAIL